jgi:hypothetical protein
MRRRIKAGGGRLTAAMLMFGLLVPAGAAAAPAKPGVTSGPAANVAQQTATLTGKVNPNEADTTYFFEYGTTTLYGTPTPQAAAGKGNKAVSVAAGIGGLAPATRYHYRLVAFNAKGVTRGGDRTFTTQRQPLGMSLNAAANPVRPNGRTQISGTLSGTGNGDRRVVLQSNPFPFTQGFQNATDVHLTNANGTFFFPILAVPVTTQYRVLLPNVPAVQSPIVTVGVQPKVTLSAKRVHGNTFRFRGSIRPAHDGAGIVVQRLRNGAWVSVSHGSGHARAAKGDVSKYSKRVRIRRSGTYRVFAGTNNGANVDSNSRTVHLHKR